MTQCDRPIVTCTRCGKEVMPEVTEIYFDPCCYVSSNKYCSGHADKRLVNRADRRKRR